jgi:hypothetical protein
MLLHETSGHQMAQTHMTRQQCVCTCSLVFWDVKVTKVLPPGGYVEVCNNQWEKPGEFDRVAYLVEGGKVVTEREALKKLLMLVDKALTYEEATKYAACDTSTEFQEQYHEHDVHWGAQCVSGGPVTRLQFSTFQAADAINYRSDPDMDDTLLYLLLSLRQLQILEISVMSGELPPQLGALADLEYVVRCCDVQSICQNSFLLEHVEIVGTSA